MSGGLGLSGRRVLCTGAAGFIGSRIVRRALLEGAKVVVLLRPQSDEARLRPVSGWERVPGDLLHGDAVREVLLHVRPEIVIHAAALVDFRADPALTPAMVQANVAATANLLEAARLCGARRVVLLGSAGEYGTVPGPCTEDGPTWPVDPYSASKRAATELALTYHRAFSLPCTVVRPFLVYGPGEPPRRLLPQVLWAALSGGDLPLTPGEQVRDFVHVDDVAEGVLRAAVAAAAAGEVLNLGTGVPTRVRDAVYLAIETAGGGVTPRFGALPYRQGEPMQTWASTARTRAVLGFVPQITLSRGLFAEWQEMKTTLRSSR